MTTVTERATDAPLAAGTRVRLRVPSPSAMGEAPHTSGVIESYDPSTHAPYVVRLDRPGGPLPTRYGRNGDPLPTPKGPIQRFRRDDLIPE